MNSKKTSTSSSENRGQGTQGGSRQQHEKAGEAGGKAPHTCRGRECSSKTGQSSSQSSKSGQSTQGGTHEQHVKAGKAGGEASHTCRGRECSK